MYFAQLSGQYVPQNFGTNQTTLGTFVDIDEDGRLDMIIQGVNPASGLTEISVIYNNYVQDAFFIKALMVGSEYGDALSGASYRLVVTDLYDNKFVVHSSQLTQSSYLALQMPYSYLGVGRSNNYVETFTAAFSIGGTRSIRVWTPIIPNSQLIIFAPESDQNNWTLELFINPTSSLVQIIIACLICLIIIGLVIIILHMGEKQEDKKNKQKAFDYL